MTIRVLGVGNSNTDQNDHRSLICGILATQGATLPLTGVFPSSPAPAVLTNVSAMVCGVGAFRAVVNNNFGNGHFLVQNDSQVDLTFAAGEAAVTRNDRIIVRVYNDAQDGSGQSDVFVEYLKGQASGAASPMPNNSLLLWEIPVPAGASAGNGGINFTAIAVDKRFYVATSGGVIPVVSVNNIQQNSPYEGQPIYVRDLDTFYVFDGSAWRAKGQVSVASSANLTSIINPWDGLIAVTRDTDVAYVYTGAAWKAINDPNAPKGIIAYGNRASAKTNIGPTETGILRLDNVPIVNGRAYKIWAAGRPFSTVSSDSYRAFLRTSTSGSATTASTSLKERSGSSHLGYNLWAIYTATATGNLSVLLSMNLSFGTGLFTSEGDAGGTTMFIEDLGVAVSDTGVDV